MLTISIKTEYWDEENEQFINTMGGDLHLEHSLISISKWESKWKKPFLGSNKTNEELYDYICCMCKETVTEELIKSLGDESINKILAYINDPMSATTVNENKKSKPSREVVTSELIYYWMIALEIPFECQYWHLNRLIKLIDICNIKNNPKKMGKNEIYKQNRDLNAARRKALKTKG